MKATVERAQTVRGGTEVLLTLTVLSPSPRTHTYRVSWDAYLSAGSPDEGETLEGDALLSLTGEEDTRLAYSRAVRILSSGDNTCRALERKLRERGFSPEAASSAVKRLMEDGYLREEEMLLRQLAVYSKRMWGPKKFLPSLIEKGFSRDAVREGLERAKETGVYDQEEVKARLLDALPNADDAARRAWLYKHGF